MPAYDDTASPRPPRRIPLHLLGRLTIFHFAGDAPVSFKITLPDGTVQRFGPAEPRFHVALKNKRALRAI